MAVDGREAPLRYTRGFCQPGIRLLLMAGKRRFDTLMLVHSSSQSLLLMAGKRRFDTLRVPEVTP